MDLIGLISEIVIALVKHGWSATSLVIFIFALFKFAPFRRFVMRNLPRKLRMLDNRMDGMDVRMSRMDGKLDAIARHMGVENWDADSCDGKTEQRQTTGQTMKSLLPQVVSVRAITTSVFTRLKETYHFQQRRMNMKSKLLSRKFLMALATGILVVLNDGLGMGLDSETIIMVVSIIGGWIFVEGGADIAKIRKEGKNADFTTPIEPRV